jgi:hypothetical protein
MEMNGLTPGSSGAGVQKIKPPGSRRIVQKSKFNAFAFLASGGRSSRCKDLGNIVIK